MFLLIDNYDSFTFNLVHFLGEVGVRSEVRRNDAIGVEEALARRPEAIVLSPGPCTPNEAGICLDLIKAASGQVPILGVCLGHQAIAQAFGAEVKRASVPMHGKTSRIHHDGSRLFEGIANPFIATRYHSLVVPRESLPPALIACAWTEDGTVMAVRHAVLPVFGVQFHPESIASQQGHELLANFVAITRGANAPAQAA
ncbi:MAG TPA: aminodeoxychorismate/anthranilate synthase component II [Acetobacteraceae bacterium]|nr:aminodeoxychorismate/anthranilate synthase component II [Acetobacteraceae bacterium]